mmetsp:Transcript_64834/g.200988  ORF Transcript_64834/g.200988 Transcript_64834/m.200988 type:complete len:149 (-) Transcript_64834:136-582(-)
MARSAARGLVCLAAVAAAAWLLVAPSAFVPAPPSAGSWAPAVAGVAAGSLAALPALAYSPEVVDAQLLLARIPGGKTTKEKGLVVPSPAEDGFTDAQVATCLVIALVALVVAWELVNRLNRGVRPIKSRDPTKGRITPLMKRFLDLGY